MTGEVIDLSDARYARDAKAAGVAACKCGAVPGTTWPMCRQASRQGRERGDYAAGCERWQRAANAAALVNALEKSDETGFAPAPAPPDIIGEPEGAA